MLGNTSEQPAWTEWFFSFISQFKNLILSINKASTFSSESGRKFENKVRKLRFDVLLLYIHRTFIFILYTEHLWQKHLRIKFNLIIVRLSLQVVTVFKLPLKPSQPAENLQFSSFQFRS